MGKAIANTDREITKISQGAWTPGNATYTQTEADHDAPDGKAILIDRITWTMAGCSLAGHTFANGQNTSPILATAEKPKVDNKYPLRKNDEGMCGGLFTRFGGSTVCICKFQITNAGQTKVEAE